MIAGLCALTVVASQVIAPASSGGLFSDSSIVASAEGAQQYEVSPYQQSEAGTVAESEYNDPLRTGLSGATYTATANPGYKFVKFVYDYMHEPNESDSNTISFSSEEYSYVDNVKAVFVKKSDSTYNVTAKTDLSYDGEEQELVEASGEGGTISYAIAPDGKSVGDVVKRDVWEAIVPEVGKVYTPDLKGSQDGSHGVSFDPSYSISVDSLAYTLENDNNPVRLMYDKDSEKYRIFDVDGYHDVKDGCDAILVTEVNETYKYIVGTFEIEKKDVNITLGHNDITWGTLIDKNTVYTIDPNNGFVSKDDAPDFDSWFDVSRTEQGGAATVGFDFNDASRNKAATYNITSAVAGDESGKTKVELYNENPDNNYTLNVTEGTITVKPYELQPEDVTLDTDSFKYDGEVKAPEVTAKVKYGKKDGTNLSYDYKDLTLGTKRAPKEDGYIGGTSKISEAGGWSLLVVGDGNFTGTIRKNWSIDKASMKVELDDITERPYDGTATEVTAKVKNTDVTVVEVGPGTVNLSASDVGKYLKDGKYTFKNAVRGIHEETEFAPGFECTVSGGQIFVGTVSYGDASDNKRWKIASYENNAITLEAVNNPTAVDLEEASVTVTYKYEKQVTSGDALGTWEEVSEAKDAGTYKVTATVQGNDNFDVSEEDATATKIFKITQRNVKVKLNADDLTKSNGYKDGTVHVTYGEGDVVESDGITLPETIDIGTGVANNTKITADNAAFADIKTALGSNYKLVIDGEPVVTIRSAKLASVEVKTSYIKQSGGDEFVSPVFIAKDENGNDFDVSKIVVVKGVDETNVAKSYNITVSDEATLNDTTDDFKLVWDVKELGTVELAATNTILYSDNVVINFFATIENEDCVDGAYVLFKYNHYGEDVEVRVDVDKTKTNKGRYVFPCSLSALEMNIDVTAELYLKDMDAPISVKSRSISDYAHKVCSSSSFGELEKNVSKALLNYGAYTQISQKYNIDSLPNAGLETDVSDVTIESNVDFVRPTAEVEGITYTSSTGVFTSAPTNRHYFKLAKSSSINDYVFKINGVEVTPVSNNGGEYFIECDPIKAYKMDDVQNVVVEKKDGTPVFDFDYSMVTYLKLASEKGNAAQKNQAKAMYNYYKAAVDFVNIKN